MSLKTILESIECFAIGLITGLLVGGAMVILCYFFN